MEESDDLENISEVSTQKMLDDDYVDQIEIETAKEKMDLQIEKILNKKVKNGDKNERN